jgi:hypothetical protein
VEVQTTACPTATEIVSNIPIYDGDRVDEGIKGE